MKCRNVALIAPRSLAARNSADVVEQLKFLLCLVDDITAQNRHANFGVQDFFSWAGD